MSDSWWPHGLQHSRLLCLSTSPVTCSDSCPLNQWCNPQSVDDAIQSSHPMLSPFPPAFNLPQHQGLFQCVSSSHYGQNIGASTSASVLPMNIQGLFHLGWTGCISLHSKDLWRVFSNIIVQKYQFFTAHFSLWSNSHSYMATGEEIALTIRKLVSKVMSLLFNVMSRFVIVFLPKSKRLLISWLQSPSAVILEPKKKKSVTVSIVSLSICHEVMGPDVMIFVFWMLNFKPAFSLSSFTFIKKLFSSSLSAIRVVSSAYLRLLMFLLAVFIPAVLHLHFAWCTLQIS